MFHKNKRIGYVVKRYPRYSETFIVNEILALERQGVEIDVFALRPPNDTHFQDLISQVKAPVHYLPATKHKADTWLSLLKQPLQSVDGMAVELADSLHHGSRELLQAAVLANQAQAQGITHLHAHFATFPALVARLAARFAGITYSFTAHAVDIFHESTSTEDLHEKFSDAAFSVTVSDYNQHYLRKRLGEIPSDIIRIYNGMDLKRFEWQPPAQRQPLILGVGRLVEKKGFRYLIDACEILKQRQIDFSCRIIGMGELQQELQQQITAKGLDDLVELSGPMPQQQVVRELQSAAIFAAPCVVAKDGNRDGLPTVLLESMALGTPCISTDVTGIPEILKHDQTGLLVAQHDADALAGQIKRLLQDGTLREQLAQNARTLIEKDFDIDRNAKLLWQHFQKTGSPISLQEAV